jgi:hypothetical protein
MNDEVERKWLWLDLKVLSQHLPGGPEENMINLCQDSQSGPRYEP